MHSHVVVDVHRHIESGYLGHIDDAQQYGLMKQVGPDLHFPDDLLILGDTNLP